MTLPHGRGSVTDRTRDGDGAALLVFDSLAGRGSAFGRE